MLMLENIFEAPFYSGEKIIRLDKCKKAMLSVNNALHPVNCVYILYITIEYSGKLTSIRHLHKWNVYVNIVIR